MAERTREPVLSPAARTATPRNPPPVEALAEVEVEDFDIDLSDLEGPPPRITAAWPSVCGPEPAAAASATARWVPAPAVAAPSGAARWVPAPAVAAPPAAAPVVAPSIPAPPRPAPPPRPATPSRAAAPCPWPAPPVLRRA